VCALSVCLWNIERRFLIRTDLVRILGTLVALSLVLPVYAADKFPDYPVRPAGDYSVTAERAGLIVGVQLVEDLKDQKTYFNTELTHKGLIPVFIVIQNGSSSDSFLFDKSGIKFGQVALSGFTPKTSMNPGETAAFNSSAFLVPVAGAVLVLIHFSNAERVQQNILRKEMQSRTLSPGMSVHGFLYLPVPKKGPREKIRLQVPITRAGTGEMFVLEVVF
jgi:hypothetical protein